MDKRKYKPQITNIRLTSFTNVPLEHILMLEFLSSLKLNLKKLNKISLRGSPLVSSVGNSYGEYIESALIQELKLAKLWSGVATKQVSGKVIEQDIDVTGFSEGSAFIKVKFTVSDGDITLFDKVISAEHTFDSSFLGAIAIPNGQRSYVELVQKLLTNLYADEEFIASIK
ncbi:hypothetical protein D172_012095 [Pseudoalteromonas sp. Bsw20308]|nr:hypothetical protein D172_012095 [Pseudoalteromonas sp. Bsw20308]